MVNTVTCLSKQAPTVSFHSSVCNLLVKRYEGSCEHIPWVGLFVPRELGGELL